MPEEVLPVVFQAGIGLSNVHERMSVLFGADFQMTLENRLGGGARVRVQFPELSDPQDESQAAAEPAPVEANL